jgi:hypothetical protein
MYLIRVVDNKFSSPSFFMKTRPWHMKHTLLLSLFSSLLLLSSCDRKSYSCHCDGGFSGAGSTMNVEAASKKRAQKKCEDNNSGPETNDGYDNCTLQ